jgi:hypothetical protein
LLRRAPRNVRGVRSEAVSCMAFSFGFRLADAYR